MTPKQILDSFSETLMQDERILSAPERALLTSLLQHAKTAANDNPNTEEAVRKVIASAVGETVAQRAFAVLGGSIVEKIVEGSGGPTTDLPETYAGKKSHKPGKPERTPGVPGTGPAPAPGPQSPGTTFPSPAVQPQSPGTPLRTPGVPASPGSPSGPQSPGGFTDVKVDAINKTALLERPLHLAAQSVILDEFLAPQELEELTRFTLEHESAFTASEVISPVAEQGVVNYEHRRSRVLVDLERHQELMLNRINAVLPGVLEKLGMERFAIAGVEAQVTASGDGDFFLFHSDNGSERVESRYLTFVYFFHREPRQFEGGELRIHDARLEGGEYVREGTYQTITPQQNQIVFFPCELMHEITPIRCASGAFADSRFTLNGWLRR